MLTAAQIDALVDCIVKRCIPMQVYLFGSYAKGTATVRSDLDLLVVKETSLPGRLRKGMLTPFLSNRLIPVDVHIVTPEEVEEYGKDPNSFLATVRRSGQLRYQKSG